MWKSLCFVIFFLFIYGITLKNDYTWDKYCSMLVESNKQTTKNIKNVLNAYSRHFAKK